MKPSDRFFQEYDIYRNRHVLAEYILSRKEYFDNISTPDGEGKQMFRDIRYYLTGMMDLYNHVTGSETSLEALERQFAPKDDLDIIRQNNEALNALQEGMPF